MSGGRDEGRAARPIGAGVGEGRGEGAAADAPEGAKILVVDDDPFILRLLEIELRASGFEVRTASDGAEGLARALEERPDLVLADVMMPNLDGLELTRRLRADPRTAGVPVIMLTARALSADKVEGLAAGADDYVVKPFDAPELVARIRGVIRRTREMRAQSPLTGLPGNVRIEEEIEARVREGRDFALLYADLDHFKAYNDHYGFLRGDEVIRATARIIQAAAEEVAGPDAFVGHVGGDDFVALVPPELAAPLAQRIVERFDAEAPALYDPGDRARGFIEVPDRRGEVRRFPLLSISIGIASTARRRFAHFAEAVEVAAEMKAYTKRSSEGSSWAVDRRAG
jgi:PleD family two-component response regulator